MSFTTSDGGLHLSLRAVNRPGLDLAGKTMLKGAAGMYFDQLDPQIPSSCGPCLVCCSVIW